MEQLFLEVLNMSLTASVLIAAVLVIRFVMKKAPKWITCLLWGIVGIRLICPFTIESTLSLIPSGKPIPSDIALMSQPEIDTGVAYINHAVNPIIIESFSPEPTASANPLQIVSFIAANVWIAGIVILFAYALLRYLMLYKKVRSSVHYYENIKLNDYIDSPFILGVFKPVIFVSSGISDNQMQHVIAHEQAHIKRLDYIWKPAGFLILIIHWFNPLVWFAYVLLCKDIEIACDEKVVSKMEKAEAISYSQTLLECSVKRRNILICPLAFGEISVKERIKHVLHYKRPGGGVVFIAIIASITIAICFLTSPRNEADSEMDNTQLITDIEDNSYPAEETDADVKEQYLKLIHIIEAAIYDSKIREELPELYLDTDGNQLCSSEFVFLYDGSGDIAYQNLGYWISDIDKDGTEELMLGASDPDPDGNYNGIIYDLYTFQKGQIVHLFSGGPRDRYYLTDNNEFVNEWSSRADDNGKKYFQYEKGIFKQVEKIDSSSSIILPEFLSIGPAWQQVADLNGDGRFDYVIFTGMDGYYNQMSLYLTGEGKVFTHKDACVIEVWDSVSAVDIDRDGENEIVLIISPHVNSMPLMEYAVIKKTDNGWIELENYDAENNSNSFPLKIYHDKGYDMFITCEGLDKQVNFNLENNYNYWKNNDEDGSSLIHQILEYYKEITSTTGGSAGNISAWGIWDIKLSEYEGYPCLVAEQGIEGCCKEDIWGRAYIYFNYDTKGKINILDLEFSQENMYVSETSFLGRYVDNLGSGYEKSEMIITKNEHDTYLV